MSDVSQRSLMLEKSKVYPPSSCFLSLPTPLRLPTPFPSRFYIRLVASHSRIYPIPSSDAFQSSVFQSRASLFFLPLRRNHSIG